MRLELWSDLECASGTRQGIIVAAAATVSRTLTNDDTLTFTAFADAPWISDLALRAVIRYTDDEGVVSEWRITEIEDWGKSNDEVRITARSPLYDLADTVIAYESGVATWFNLGAVDLTAGQYLGSFIIPAMTDAGATWWAVGTVEVQGRHSIAWDKWTPLQLLNEVAAQSGGEIYCRRLGATGYAIDVLVARGSNATEVLLHTDRNLTSVKRTTRSDPYRNALIATGAVPTGGIEAAQIGRAAWEVAEVSGTIIKLQQPGDVDIDVAEGLWGDVNADGVVDAGDAQQIARYAAGLSVTNEGACIVRGDVDGDGAVTQADADEVSAYSVSLTCTALVATTCAAVYSPARGPAIYAGQFASMYVLNKSAALTAITTNTATNEFTVADATGIAVGDHVEIRADATGTLLTELRNPTGVTAYGRVVGTYEVPEARGERNHVPNPLMTDWTTEAYGMYCQVGDCTNTQMPLTGLVSGTSIYAGDRLTCSVRLAGTTASGGVFRIIGDVTATDGTCTVTLAVTATSSAGRHAIVGRMYNRLPTGWTVDTSSSFADQPVLAMRRNGGLGGETFSCLVASSCTGFAYVTLTNITAETVIRPGDVLVHGTVSQNLLVLDEVTADASNIATVAVWPEVPATYASGVTLTVARPSVVDSVSGKFAAVLLGNSYGATNYADITYAPFLTSPSYRVKYDANSPTLWASAGLTYMAARADALATSNPTSGTDGYPAQVAIVDVSSTAVALATVTDVARTLVGGTSQDVTLRTSYTMTADKTLAVRIKPALGNLTSSSPVFTPTATIVRWVSLFITTDEQQPFTESSHANALWLAANDKLSDVSEQAVTYEIGYLDLARMAGWEAGDETLEIGGSVRVYDAARGIDDTVRVVGLTVDLFDPSACTVELQSVSERLAALLAKQKKQARQWVGINTAAAGDSPTPVYTQTQPTPHITITGTVRASDDGSGVVTFTEYA